MRRPPVRSAGARTPPTKARSGPAGDGSLRCGAAHNFPRDKITHVRAQDRRAWPRPSSGNSRRRDDLFERLVEGIRDYAIFVLDPDGRVASWNAGAQRIKGYLPAEIIGRHFSVFYTPEAIDRHWPQHELAAALRTGRVEDEGWRVRKDGSRFWANVVITADPRRRRAPHRVLQDHARPHRAARARGAPAPQRGALPAAARGRRGLRDHHARPGRPHLELERGRAADQGLHARRDPRPVSRTLLLRRGRDRGPARGRAARRGPAPPRRGRRLARAQGRLALLGATWWSPPCTTTRGACAASPR